MKNAKIYIVDDSSIQLILLEKVLQREGFDVEAFNNGHDLIKNISVYTPDLIISDIHMPELNGFELIKEVRNLPKGNDIPCFLISSKGDETIREQARSMGADKFIKKPFEYSTLIDVVNDLLQEKVF